MINEKKINKNQTKKQHENILTPPHTVNLRLAYNGNENIQKKPEQLRLETLSKIH